MVTLVAVNRPVPYGLIEVIPTLPGGVSFTDATSNETGADWAWRAAAATSKTPARVISVENMAGTSIMGLS